MGYFLKYKDENVLWFSLNSTKVDMINKDLLPFSLKNMVVSFDMIKVFSQNRVLKVTKEYYKEIIKSYGIKNNSLLDICIACKGLCLYDSYWISEDKSSEKWKDVSLLHNDFSKELQLSALTGCVTNIASKGIVSGELTNRESKASCYMKDDDSIYLVKKETLDEISSEIITYYLASALGLKCHYVAYSNIFNLDCYVTKLYFSDENEFIPCADIMSGFNERKFEVGYEAYDTIFNICKYDLIKLQLLDYITLNTDRDFNNFGLHQINGEVTGMYPIFGNSNSLSGNSGDEIYKISGLSFNRTLNNIKSKYSSELAILYPQLLAFKNYVSTNEFRGFFLNYKSSFEYVEMMKRLSNILN